VRLGQSAGEPPVEIDVSGEWVSTVSVLHPPEYDVELEIADPRLRGDGIGSVPAEAGKQVERRLARPFWATYRDDGELLAVHFFKDVNPSDRNLLQMIATAIQLVRPNPNPPLWTALERDGAGSYLALYHRPDSNAVVKHKLKYVYTDGAAGAPTDGLHVDVDHSELRFSLDPEGGVMALDGSDQVRMGVPVGDKGQLVATTEIHLGNLRRRLAPELVGSLARAHPNVVSSPVVTHQLDPEQVRAQRDQRLIEGRSTESLLAAAMAEGGDEMLPDRLAALFRRRPEAAAAALALLRKSGARKRITDALATAGSPAAIEAIGALAKDRAAPSRVRVDALTALVLVQHPTSEAILIPVALLDDGNSRIASTARIMSGALAHAGRAEYAVEADTIDAALIVRYRKAEDTGELCDLLAALGNSVGVSTLPVIEDALHDSRAPVRAAAARALRLAGGPEIDRLLSATITSDPEAGVRAAGIFAASFHRPIGPQLGDALVRVARGDPVEYVRSAAVIMLRQNPDAEPRTAATLAWIAEHDDKPGVRRIAREALMSVSGQHPR
jgi:hypothetical protein